MRIVLALAVVLSACAPRYPALTNRPLYTCCNLHFNRDGDASDANYENIAGTTVPLGTRVTVVSDHRNAIDFRAAIPSQQVFTLVFRFGRSQMKAAEYFSLVLVPNDPTPRLKSLDPSIATAVREGRIMPGMTKADVLIARSYPPLHHTAGVEADRWTYNESPMVVDVVDFVDGRVTTVTRAGAPRQ